MLLRERETCVADRRTALKLNDIADEVSLSRHLVDAAFMASEYLPNDLGGPLCALLDVISDRLRAVVVTLTETKQEGVSDVA